MVSGADGRFRRGAAWPDAPATETPLTAAEVGVELARAAADGSDGRHMAELLWGATRRPGPRRRRSWPPTSWSACSPCGCRPQRPIDPEERELAASIAGQTAVGITNVRMIERLTAHNAIKDFLEDLSAGRTPAADLRERGRALGVDVDLPHVVLLAVPRSGPATRSWDDVARALEVAAGRDVSRVALRPPRRRRARARAPRARATRPTPSARLREIHAGLNKDHPLAIGLSQRCEGAAGSRTGFEEAEHAVTAAAIVSSTPDVVGFDDLGAYKYLLRVSQDGRTRDPRGEALRKLDEYDRRHRSQLLLTLEEYLKRRGNIAQAAQTLYVHPNTLRQRLRRIHDLTGLDVQHEDWLMVEIELKLLRLEHVLGQPPR